MKDLAEQFLAKAEERVAEMTIYINATNALGNDPRRKAIVFQRRRLIAIIPPRSNYY